MNRAVSYVQEAPDRSLDLDRWRTTFDLMRQHVYAQPDFTTEREGTLNEAPARRGEGQQIVSQFQRSRDLGVLAADLDAWVQRPGEFTQLSAVVRSWLPRVISGLAEDGGRFADALAEAFTTPTSYEAAAAAIVSVEDVVRSAGDLSRIPTLLSAMWSCDSEANWPVLWPGGTETFQTLGWMGRHLTHAERYVSFADLCRAFAQPAAEAQRVVTYMADKPAFVGIGEAWPALCSEATWLHNSYRPGTGYESAEAEVRAAALAQQLRGHAALVGRSAHKALEGVSKSRLSETSLQTRTDSSARAAYRSDSHSTWLLPASSGGAPSFRLWMTNSGVAFGLMSGWDGPNQADRHEELGARLERSLPSGVQFIHVDPATATDRLKPSGATYPGGEVFVGRWFPHNEAVGRVDLIDDLLATARILLPLIDTMRGAESRPEAIDEEMAAALESFLNERPYPAERDNWHQDQRRELARALDPETLAAFDLATFKRIISGRAYGATGTHSVMDARLAQLDAQGLEALARAVTHLLWGEGDDADRIDAVVKPADDSQVAIEESVALKLLAIAHPHRYLPVYSMAGSDGKVAMAQALGVLLPRRMQRSRGRLQVLANDRLRATLETLLPGDPWGQVQFAQWLTRKGENTIDPERDLVAEAAADLLVDESFLQEISGLLEDKKQIIFYGPPGTGKTYLAQRFAAALQPDASKRSIVQFHPSTSYEDFFEGFRPRLDAGGAMVYELRKGPLALLAEAAEADPTTPHVMIIDEINRANLPRVFGELLFLLEYRSHSVMTSYRPDEGFQLPPNLYFIGTMNTADRSIALVDAALRRRFHFVPFMPHEGPMEGLMERWLAKNDGPVWVAGLVDRVNAELRQILRGPHLQIGHSHFMTRDLSDESLRRIWQYGVYPFIEDQLYGREDVLATFTWDAVVARHGEAARADVQGTQRDG